MPRRSISGQPLSQSYHMRAPVQSFLRGKSSCFRGQVQRMIKHPRTKSGGTRPISTARQTVSSAYTHVSQFYRLCLTRMQQTLCFQIFISSRSNYFSQLSGTLPDRHYWARLKFPQKTCSLHSFILLLQAASCIFLTSLSLAELSCNGLDTFIQSHRLIAAQS